MPWSPLPPTPATPGFCSGRPREVWDRGIQHEGTRLGTCLDSAAQMRDAVKDEPNFKLGYAIPSFFDNANRAVTWGGTNKPAAYHLLDILNTVPNGYIAIMAYREKAEGTNGTIAISNGEVEYSRKETMICE